MPARTSRTTRSASPARPTARIRAPRRRVIRDGNRTVTVARDGSASAVVWNPWVAKSAAMSDFGDDEWTGMLCVETANAKADAVTLEPGAEHTMTARITEVDHGQEALIGSS